MSHKIRDFYYTIGSIGALLGIIVLINNTSLTDFWKGFSNGALIVFIFTVIKELYIKNT